MLFKRKHVLSSSIPSCSSTRVIVLCDLPFNQKKHNLLLESANFHLRSTSPLCLTTTIMTTISEGDRFSIYTRFKEALADSAVSANLSTRLQRSQRDCVIAVCAVKDRPFHVSAAFSVHEECVIIKILWDSRNRVGSRHLPVSAEGGNRWLHARSWGRLDSFDRRADGNYTPKTLSRSHLCSCL